MRPDRPNTQARRLRIGPSAHAFADELREAL
jgi:hypothetical protein